MRPQRLHAVLALLFLSLFLSLGTGYAIYYRLLAVTTLVLAGSALWAYLNLWGTRITFQRTFGKLQVGESVDSRITIHNSAPLPKLGLEIEDMPELPGHNSGAVVNVPGSGEMTLASSIPLRHRGIYQVGAPTVTSSDPFSFVRLRRRNPGEQQFVVYPYMVEIPPFSITRGKSWEMAMCREAARRRPPPSPQYGTISPETAQSTFTGPPRQGRATSW